MEKKKLSRKQKIWLFVSLGVIVNIALVAGLVFLILNVVYKQLDKMGLNDKTQTFLEAVVEQDDEKLRTVADPAMPDAHELHEQLEKSGYHLSGEVRVGRPYSVQINSRQGGTSVTAVYRVTVGEKRYRVTVGYLENAESGWITSFYIR